MFTNKALNYNYIDSGEVSFTCPSNIALVKYWGKYGRQLPENPSLSITLDNAHTKTSVAFSKHDKDVVNLSFLFEGHEKQDFSDKIKVFLESICDYFPFLLKYNLTIHSENTFPHSSGIASSASSMGALAMCLCSIEQELSGLEDVNYFLDKASFIARLGSGSASRSIYPKMASWGVCELENSSNEYATEFNSFHETFDSICDSVAIISKKEKSVSSRAGHNLMKSHPFRETRFLNAKNNLTDLVKSLNEGDFNTFIRIVESEALELHGLMMNSNPSFILMAPNTLEVIHRIRKFRDLTNAKVCFTLDAGPNVHILYLNCDKDIVLKFIEEEIKPLCEDGLIIHDHMGSGPKQC